MLQFIPKSFSFILFFAAFNQVAFSQHGTFIEVDSFVTNFDEEFKDVPTLAKQLTDPFDTELEKSRALFMWIAQRVRYDCKKFRNPVRPRIKAYSQEEMEEKLALHYEE